MSLAVLPCFSQSEAPQTPLPAPDILVADVALVAFDTETTGLSPNNDRIVEIGATRFEDGKPREPHSWLVNPQRDIPRYAEKVHGISEAMVADQPPFKEVYPLYSAFAGDAVLLAHNANFDIRFLSSELRRNGLELPDNQVIDTLKLFRNWFPDAPSHNLGKLAVHVGVETGRMHRAEADATIMLGILQKGMEDRDGKVTWGELVKDAGGLMRFGP